MRVLTAENALVRTASVTVRSLTIEGRQVTLSVFRQLIEEDIVAFSDWSTPATLRGVGWGHVRYLLDAPVDQAINLVWQKGNELRRCIVQREKQDGWLSVAANIQDALVNVRTKESVLYDWQRYLHLDGGTAVDRRELANNSRVLRLNPTRQWPWSTPPAGLEVTIAHAEVPADVVDPAWKDSLVYINHRWTTDLNARRDRDFDKVFKEYEAQVRQRLQEEVAERSAWIAARDALVAPLFDLPQLFIAT